MRATLAAGRLLLLQRCGAIVSPMPVLFGNMVERGGARSPESALEAR